MIQVRRGCAYPLGPSVLYQQELDDGSSLIHVNLALFAQVDHISVCIFAPLQSDNSTVIRDFYREVNFEFKTGDVWHLELRNIPKHSAYAFKVISSQSTSESLLLDPYSKWIQSRGSKQWMRVEGENYGISPSRDLRQNVKSYLVSFPNLASTGVRFPFRLSRFCAPQSSETFEWGSEKFPQIPYNDLVIYEAHIKALTPQGTFEAAIDRISYLKWLGANAIQLMPIFEFSETEMGVFDGDYSLLNVHDPSKRKGNMWGYSPMSWFSPMNRYSDDNHDGGAAGLKRFVKALHDNGMECFLDVVYNHSSNSSCPLHQLHIQSSYYIGEEEKNFFKHCNISGCGNTLSPNKPVMHHLILESLRWFVIEYHIDGFRLDAAGVLCRDEEGQPVKNPPILQHISKDPILKNTKFIVEGWDAGDGIGSPNMLLGSKDGFPYGEHFCEWNAEWRDSVRRFVRGDKNSTKSLCRAIKGSRHLFKNTSQVSCRGLSGANRSLNFVACHDGFSLADVVSYKKRKNKDGYDEISFDCGSDGVTTNKRVIEDRNRCLRFFVFLLAISRGVPMITQGDELGFSKQGNSNTWNDPLYFCCPLPEKPWETVQTEGLVRFTRFMLKQRRQLNCLRGADFFDDLVWLNKDGSVFSKEKQTEESMTVQGFIAMVIASTKVNQPVYIACNGSDDDIEIHVPVASALRGVKWIHKVDTSSNKWKRDSPVPESVRITNVRARSCILLVGHR